MRLQNIGTSVQVKAFRHPLVSNRNEIRKGDWKPINGDPAGIVEEAFLQRIPTHRDRFPKEDITDAYRKQTQNSSENSHYICFLFFTEPEPLRRVRLR